MRGQSVVMIVGWAALTGSALFAQQTFRAGVTAVVLDVIVTDEQGRSIPDLVKDDFEIIEDNQPRAVLSATFVSLPIDADRSLARSEDVWNNRIPATRRVFTIVIDDLDTAPRDAPRARDVVRQFISMLPDGDLAAVVYTGQQTGAQEFTGDKARLLATLEPFTGRRPEDKDLFGDLPAESIAPRERQMNFLRVLDTIQNVTAWLAAVEGRRKAVLFVTGAVPSLFSDLSDSRISDRLRSITTAAMLANVAIYPMDARGLAAPDDTPTETTMLAALARETGGALTVNTNNLARGFETLVRDSSAYYLIGYSPGPETDAKGLHHVVVRTRRKGAVVRARRAYGMGRAVNASKATDITHVLGSPLPGGRLPLELHAAAFADAKGRGRVVAMLEVMGEAVDFERRGASQSARLTYAVIASDVSGKVLARDSRRVTFQVSDIRREQIGASRVRFVAGLDLKPGTYRIRAAVVDENREEHGVVAGDLDVPDYARSRLAMSGILLASASERGPVRREDVRVFETRLPAPPTTQRTFGSDDDVDVYAEAYATRAAPGTLRVTASVLDAGDRVVNEQQLTVESQTTGIAGGRCYAVRAPLQVRQLTPGPYTFQLRVGLSGAGEAIHRVTFTIR